MVIYAQPSVDVGFHPSLACIGRGSQVDTRQQIAAEFITIPNSLYLAELVISTLFT